jgi:hypothetical protein
MHIKFLTNWGQKNYLNLEKQTITCAQIRTHNFTCKIRHTQFKPHFCTQRIPHVKLDTNICTHNICQIPIDTYN